MTSIEAIGRRGLLDRISALAVLTAVAVGVAGYLIDAHRTAIWQRSSAVVLGASMVLLWILLRLCVLSLATLVPDPPAQAPVKLLRRRRAGVVLATASLVVVVPAFVVACVSVLRHRSVPRESIVVEPGVVLGQVVLVACVLAAVWTARSQLTWQLATIDASGERRPLRSAQDDGAGGGEVICCSGGGIRSASFCLGALQYLVEQGRYHAARAVFAVSGGSWMASAFAALDHQLRARQERADPEDASGEPGLFGLDSPELRRFRRDTRYLSSSSRQRVLGGFSFLFGMAINLCLILATMRIAAWFIGWLVAVTADVVLPGSLLAPALALAVSGGAYFLSRCWIWFMRRFPRPRTAFGAERLASLAVRAFFAGLAVVLVMPGIAVMNLGWRNLSERTSFGGSAFEFAADPAALAALITSVVAFAGLVRSSLKGPGAASSPWARLLSFLRTKVAPALGSLLVLCGGYLLLSLWSVGYAASFTEPTRRVIDLPLLLATAVVIALPLINTANSTTLYAFFRDSLAEAYLMRRTGTPPIAETLPEERIPRFSDLGGQARRPALVLCATANISDARVVPAGRGATPFVFASDGIGGADVIGGGGKGCIGLSDPNLPGGRRLVAAKAYEGHEPHNTTLASAMAISGAAVAPVAGRENSNVGPYRLLMSMANLRLGVWLKNPYWCGESTPDNKWWQRIVHRLDQRLSSPGPWLILHEGLGRTSILRRYLYVTDGGHLDNLGLIEALRAKPSSVIVLDASADAENSFITLAHAIATARMDLGVEISGFDLRASTRLDSVYVRRGWMVGQARDSSGWACRILYIKALYVRDATLDLAGYKHIHPEFPLTGTTDQLYDEFDLEAFRQLGYLITTQALSAYDSPPMASTHQQPADAHNGRAASRTLRTP